MSASEYIPGSRACGLYGVRTRPNMSEDRTICCHDLQPLKNWLPILTALREKHAMARIPDGVIERLKETVSVERLAEARGVMLKKHGAGDLIGQCPFHDDKTPSLVITPAKNLWHCLGACQAGGTVIDWVMRAEGVSFRHSVELLQDDALPLVAASSTSTATGKHSAVEKLPAALERNADDAKLLEQVIEYYHQTLLQCHEALEYLGKRGLSSSEAINHFKVRFANRTLGYRLPEKNSVEG